MQIRQLPCGERAVLIEVDDLEAVLALRAAVAERVAESPTESVWANVVDILPAARTVLLSVDEPAALPQLRLELDEFAQAVSVQAGEQSERVVTVPVIYDGPDLEEVAQLTGMSAHEVIEAHTGREWRVAFGGFAPGFPYLVGGDERLEVPRRDEPRTKVPAGSVGLAGTFSGIYPRSSPGGWQLIGRTEEVLWDEHREPPALLHPGWGVRFEAVQPDANRPDRPGRPSHGDDS